MHADPRRAAGSRVRQYSSTSTTSTSAPLRLANDVDAAPQLAEALEHRRGGVGVVELEVDHDVVRVGDRAHDAVAAHPGARARRLLEQA
jgi:hypothetical protein